MQKPKRGTQKSSTRLVIFLLTIIAVLIVALGGVVFTAYVEPLSDDVMSITPTKLGSDLIIPNDVVTDEPAPCAPLKRIYNDLTVTNEMAQSSSGSYATGGSGSGGGNPGVNSIPATSVASMNSNGSAPLAPTGTSGAIMSTMEPTVYMPPTMGGPATYTPVPSSTPSPWATSVPQTQIQQPNANVNAPQQPVTELQARLSAGEIDDNAEWNVYLTYRRNFAGSPANASPVDDVDVRDRQLIRVMNKEGEPILGAYVDILSTDNRLIQSSCTYATGYTMFLPHAEGDVWDDGQSFLVRVSKGDVRTSGEFQLSDDEWMLTLEVEQKQANLDILFLIDATGSMDDEIAQLTNNILYISEEIHKLPDDISVRYGLVSYKDGSFPTQVWDFTSDVNQFQSQLAQLFTAGGAGETLNDGLDRALHAVQWRGDDTAKLIFLVGDEPPGVYENHPSYAKSMLLAGQAGIKVHPIASSGLDVQGEYIFRQIAQTTMGHFIFLTYDDGQTAVQGGGEVVGSTGNEDFGEYSVEQLHEIVLNLIRDELSHSYQFEQ